MNRTDSVAVQYDGMPRKKKKPLTVSDLAKQGGNARAKNLTPAQRSEIARLGGKAKHERAREGRS